MHRRKPQSTSLSSCELAPPTLKLMFPLRFIIHAIEPDQLLQEAGQLWVLFWVHGDLKERLEDVVQHVLEGSDEFVLFVHCIQTRNLDHPLDVRMEEIVIDDPPG